MTQNVIMREVNAGTENKATAYVNYIDSWAMNINRALLWSSPNDIKKVIYNDPATIVLWKDGSKTVVKCSPEDTYDKKMGFLLCMFKRRCGSSRAFNDALRRWCPEE